MTSPNLHTPPMSVAHNEARRWRTSPLALVRVASLPATTLERLAFNRCVALLDERQHLEGALSEEREALSAGLHEAIGALPEHPEARRALINLRRKLYRDQTPNPIELETAQTSLSAALFEAVRRTCSRLERLQTLQNEFPRALAEDQLEAQRAVKRLMNEQPQFLAALESVTPALLERVEAYRRAADTDSTLEWRRVESSLGTYLTRSSTKTSPLSQFAWSALTSWPPEPGALRGALRDGSSAVRVELHYGVYNRLLERITNDPDLQACLEYRLNPDWHVTPSANRVFVRSRQARLRDRLLELPDSAWLRSLSERFGPGSVLTRATLEAALLEAGVGASQVATVWERLRELGILVPRLQLADDLPNPLARLIEQLESYQHPSADAIGDGLRRVRADLERYAHADHLGRASCRERIQHELEVILHHQPSLPARLIYENAGAQVQHLNAPASLQPTPAELEALAALVTLLDRGASQSWKMLECFVRRYGVGGRCHDPHSFLITAMNESETASDADSATVTAYLATLEQHRDRVLAARDAVLERLARQVDGEELELEADWVMGLHRDTGIEWPSHSMALLTQVDPKHDRLVLNDVFPGNGTLLLRQARFMDDPSWLNPLRAEVERTLHPDRPMQLVLSSGSSVNAVPVLTRDALRTPGTGDEGDGARLHSFHLRHDAASHRLELQDRSGQRVVPLYLGTLATVFLAPTDRALANLTPNVTWRPTFAPELERAAGETAPDGRWRVWPRVRVGRFVVSRRTWVVPAQTELIRRTKESDLEYWSRVRCHLRAQGVGDRFFAIPGEDWLRQIKLGADPGLKEARTKPQYFDLRNFWMLRLFEKWCRERGEAWSIQEPLPDPNDAWFRVGDEAHVSEFCVELYHRRGEP